MQTESREPAPHPATPKALAELDAAIAQLEAEVQALPADLTAQMQQELAQLDGLAKEIAAQAAALTHSLQAFASQATQLNPVYRRWRQQQGAMLLPPTAIDGQRHHVRLQRQRPAHLWETATCEVPSIEQYGGCYRLVKQTVPLGWTPPSLEQPETAESLQSWLTRSRQRVLKDFSGL
ncbi:hypothetical protein [Synechococcus elongatus]|uniref:Uncharacterized protein n=2 Tax=Synechococcus elongatus TaxID=32046 RepID=A0AAN1UTG7_SYNEL|nr:hypothetical protein [Synechococcus elongatus]AZB71521.1 hypothetical protein DOP62_01170 [Synechococcus elongatus PCC 11801]QFZ91079.1 hypothetical protein EKO22_00605 [Synechococcus elongatus PCC 11802]